MPEIMDWIDGEAERLEGKTGAVEPERIPEVLRTALGTQFDKTDS